MEDRVNWIKVEIGTPMKPEIDEIMDACSVSRGEAFLAWFKLWSWLDETTEDGFIPRATPERIDARSGLKGMAEALEISGWLSFNSDGCSVVNWHKHNGESAKKRASDTVRKQKSRG